MDQKVQKSPKTPKKRKHEKKLGKKRQPIWVNRWHLVDVFYPTFDVPKRRDTGNPPKKIWSRSKKSPKICALPYLFFPDFSKKTQKLKKAKSILEIEKRTFYKCPNNEISE